MSTNYHLNKIQ